MQLHDILYYVFAVISTLYVLHFGMYLVGANLYDIGQIRRRRHMRPIELTDGEVAEVFKEAIQDSKRMKPIKKGLVTVCIPAHNESLVIERCLDSIGKSTYPKIQILVADDASSDGTKQIVRDYQHRHPEVDVRVFRMRQNVGKARALNVVLRRHGQGEFVMSIDADSLIAPSTIMNAVRYFSNPDIAGVAANVQILDEATVLGMLQKFEHMVGYRSKKTYSLMNCEFVIGGVASTYRMDVLRQVGFYDSDTVTEDIGLSTKIVCLGNRHHKMVYAADVVAMTEGVANFKTLVRQRYRWKYGSFQNLVKYRRLLFNLHPRYSYSLTVYRLPMAILSEIMLLLSPIAWTYALYMTFAQYNLQLVIGAYMTITAYMLIILWFDEHLRIKSRLRLSVYATVAYFIFYVMDLVQLIAMIRCLFHSSTLFRQKEVGSTWISPKRIGRQVAEIG